MPKRYSKEDHEKAFTVWCETHNWSAVQNEVGCTYETPRRWAGPDYKCEYGCAYHGWDRLEREKNVAHTAKMRLIEAGNFDPAAHETAIKQILMGGGVEDTTRVEVIKNSIRGDLDRAAHWEYIWAKAYYAATGQVISWSQFNNKTEPTMEALEEKQEVLRKGLHPVSLEQAVKIMKMAEVQIFTILGRPAVQAASEVERDLSDDELREMRARLLNQKPRLHGEAAG